MTLDPVTRFIIIPVGMTVSVVKAACGRIYTWARGEL